MRTTLDCLPCFLRQALYAARLAAPAHGDQKRLMDEVARLLPRFNLDRSPPENAIGVYDLIAELSGCEDPFSGLKESSTRLALTLRPHVREQIRAAADPLLTAFKFAIAGNIIDYGAHHDFDVEATVNACLEQELAVNDYSRMARDIERAEKILYLADNCGELVFDGLVIELLGKKVTLAVKERPIINDALEADALACGLDKACGIVSNGTGCPGTPLDLCSTAFKQTFRQADLIISKGQGNFETLSDTPGPIYFLLTIKCPVVADHIAGQAKASGTGAAMDDMILMKSPHFTAAGGRPAE